MAVTRRRNSEGRTVGWTVQVSVPNPEGGRGQRYALGTFPTKKLADHIENVAKLEIAQGTFISPHQKRKDALAAEAVTAPVIETVADLVERWFRAKRRAVAPNTASGYRMAIDKYVIPAWGHIPATVLTRTQVQDQVNQWEDGGMGARLVHRSVMILHAALEDAVNSKDVPIEFNVATGIRKQSAKKKLDIVNWTPEHMGAFLTASADDALFPFWHLALLEGMRRSEALGLRWSDVDFSADEKHATAYIRQTVIADMANGGAALIQSRTKTKKSARAVVLTPATVAALKAHRDRQRFRRQAVGSLWGTADLIVTNEIGEVVRPDRVKQLRKRLMEQAGVPPLTTHQLRHTAATIMLKAGTPVVLVSHKLGHANISTTADLYGHIEASDQEQGNAAIQAYLDRASATGTNDR